MKNTPQKIYLQIGDEADLIIGNEDPDFNDLYKGAISWSDQRINENDIEYSLSEPDSELTRHKAEITRLQKEVERLNHIVRKFRNVGTILKGIDFNF